MRFVCVVACVCLLSVWFCVRVVLCDCGCVSVWLCLYEFVCV